MANPPDVGLLTEELTIQQVILESLQDQSFDGVEQQRADTKKEIERLQSLLQLAEARSPIPSDDASGPLDVRPATPTPRKRSRAQEPRLAPVPYSLPSRKRPFEPTTHDTDGSHNKSRRGTPAPQADEFASSSANSPDFGRGLDVVDLTGDDLDFESSCRAEQMREERRQEQMNQDRELALQLSSQDPLESTTSPVVSTANASQADAFQRMMATQRSNSRPPANPQRAQPVTAAPNIDLLLSAGNLPGSMPGSYDAGWDEAPPPDLPPSQYPLAGPSHQPAAPSIVHPPFRPPYHFPVYGGPGSGYEVMGGQGAPFSAGNGPYHSLDALPSYGRTLGPPPPLSRGPINGFFSRGAADLYRTIQNTSMYNYATQTNHQGQPLPDRLSNFLQDALHDPRVTDKELNDLLQNIRPDMDIPERNRDGTPAGLVNALYPHQELALSWMKKMEDGTNKGGILADDMGLGKTISTMALMLTRPATCRPKTNLIIGPLSLIRQWEEELNKKIKYSHRLSVFVYHNRKATTEDLLKYDVVLTTYGTVAQELKKYERFMEENANRKIDLNDKAHSAKFPLLHPERAEFHRVILDESQCIKNKETRTAKACYRLRASYRWCLTGTPMMNGVLELFSLLHFLRIKPYCVWENFRQAFGIFFGRKGDPKSVAMNRLRALLRAIMLRRKKDSQLDGRPILKLPAKKEEIIYAKLSPDEREFYDQLEKKSQVLFSKYLRENTVGKNYSNILVLLLRMRQACCHPHLNLDVDDASGISCDLSRDEMMEVVRGLDASIVERIRSIEAFECPICYDVVQSPSFFVPCGHDSCKDCLTRLADNAAAANLRAGNESERATCPVCRGAFNPRKCFTYEAFRSVHIPEMAAHFCGPEEGEGPSTGGLDSDSESDNSESDSDWDDEMDCRGNLRGFVVCDDDVDDDQEDEHDEGKRQRAPTETETGGDPCSTMASAEKVKNEEKKSKKGKQKKTQRDAKGKKVKTDVKPLMLKNLRLEATRNRDAHKRYMRYLRKTWMPAAKVTECLALLRKIEERGEKTIVFSQWTLLLDLLEVAMRQEEFEAKAERYDGSMSCEERVRAAQAFRDRREVKVMLVSLRAGNAGLNLTAANNVIIMDPFWNPYTELQAIDRAHRIGQQKEVRVYRILTQGTVEDRIVELQKRKREIVEAALDETESMKIGRLNLSELKFLFNGAAAEAGAR